MDDYTMRDRAKFDVLAESFIIQKCKTTNEIKNKDET